MKICILAAGAAGMYCGSCLRDNTLARALIRAGHQVALIPLYTPLRTDTPSASISQVFYGGVNTYLQFASSLFRHTPRAVDWVFDRPWLLSFAGKFGAQTSPAKLGPFILSVLRGDEGPQLKELRRLLDYVRSEVRPEVVSLPNLMFIGMARLLRNELGVPVVCELSGEDIFLDAMSEPYRSEAQASIRQRCGDVGRFVATSAYYAARMAEYLDIATERIDVVYPGVSREHLRDLSDIGHESGARPRAVGYLARICPEKGLDRLVDAFAILRRMPGMGDVRLKAAGYLGAAHRQWFGDLEQRIASGGLHDAFTYAGEVDLAGKLAFLDSIDLLSVPTAYAEAKGIYVLEAMARGVPVAQPDHGAFPELVGHTGGGVLAPAGDAEALARAMADLLEDPARRAQLGQRGRTSIEAAFTDEHMAEKMLMVYRGVQ